MKRLFTIVFITVISFGISSAQSGTLEAIEDVVSNADFSGNITGGAGVFEGLYYALDGTYQLLFFFNFENPPFRRLDDGGQGFAKYPYHEYSRGLHHQYFDGGRKMSAEIRSHYFAESLEMYGSHAHLRFSPTRAISIEGNYFNFNERLETGLVDNLQFYTLSLNYYRVRTPKFNLYWGGGFIGMTRDRNYNSACGNLGLSYYFERPVSLHADAQFSSINGNFVALHQYRLQFHVKRPYMYVGYQQTDVGNQHINAIIGGLGIHF